MPFSQEQQEKIKEFVNNGEVYKLSRYVDTIKEELIASKMLTKGDFEEEVTRLKGAKESNKLSNLCDLYLNIYPILANIGKAQALLIFVKNEHNVEKERELLKQTLECVDIALENDPRNNEANILKATILFNIGFNEKDPQKQKDYYTQALECLTKTPLEQRFDPMVNRLENDIRKSLYNLSLPTNISNIMPPQISQPVAQNQQSILTEKQKYQLQKLQLEIDQQLQPQQHQQQMQPNQVNSINNNNLVYTNYTPDTLANSIAKIAPKKRQAKTNMQQAQASSTQISINQFEDNSVIELSGQKQPNGLDNLVLAITAGGVKQELSALATVHATHITGDNNTQRDNKKRPAEQSEPTSHAEKIQRTEANKFIQRIPKSQDSHQVQIKQEKHSSNEQGRP